MPSPNLVRSFGALWWVLGGTALLVIFVFALALHAARGEFASQLLTYAAAVTFVIAHGRVPLVLITGRAQHQQARG
ncbi:MAG: hypothetical protein IT359_10745 [Gemmatimonadaceae bacterium]|nr:hypothetical protein [Gemmatimonadaceae bacterium]